jgi:hypothetical protein
MRILPSIQSRARDLKFGISQGRLAIYPEGQALQAHIQAPQKRPTRPP